MMNPEPQREHRWLEGLVGEWTYESEPCAVPGQEPAKFTGSESVRSLGGLWVVGHGKGDMPGGATARTMITLGFDPERKRFVGTWVGSMMANMWVYDGDLDASGKVLTLNTTGPSFDGSGKTAKYQDVITIKDADNRTLTSRVQGDDGKWTEFMSANYRRRGK
jgi:Protein of unknown function (DUF1579)